MCRPRTGTKKPAVSKGAMQAGVSIIERAYELAGSGDFETLERVANQLIAEGYEGVNEHLSAPTLRRQLSRLFDGAALE